MAANQHIEVFNTERDKVLAFLHGEYSRLQTGRASAALVEHISVDAYGQQQQLKSVAGISIQDAKTIVIQPWDTSILGDVEKAIQAADLGANPVNDGSVIRLTLPPMTEERRQQMVKVVHQLAEEARISLRHERQKHHDTIKDKEKDEDVRYTLLEALDKAMKEANDMVEETKSKKEEEVMTV